MPMLRKERILATSERALRLMEEKRIIDRELEKEELLELLRERTFREGVSEIHAEIQWQEFPYLNKTRHDPMERAVVTAFFGYTLFGTLLNFRI